MKARKSQKDWVERRISQLADDRQYCHPRWPQEEKYIKLETKRVKSLPLLNSFGAWFYLEWIVLILIILTTATSVVYYYKDDTATRYLYTRTISIVNLLVWLRLLKYVRPFHGIGTLVIILGETVTDFLNWAFLFLLFLVPFTAAFWMNFGAISIHPVHGYKYGKVLVMLLCFLHSTKVRHIVDETFIIYLPWNEVFDEILIKSGDISDHHFDRSNACV